VELREVPVPTNLEDDEILLRTRAVGVCGSDIHQSQNTQSWAVNVPVILGHEFAGEVVQAGKAVRGFREGDRVTSETAARICGHCLCCRTGEYNLCPERRGFGYGVDGAMAGFVRVPARCLHHLPDSVSFEKAGLTEPCCVAYNATCVKTRIRPGDTVLVFGPGPIGLMSLVMARLSGAGWVGVAGLKRDEGRLAIAKSLGADQTFSGGDAELLEATRSIGDRIGVDAVIEASGASATLKTALAAVRPAGQICKVGWGPQPLEFSLDALVQKAVCLQGSFSHNFVIWERVISLFACGKLDPTPIVGRVEPLAGWRVCFEEMREGKIVKALLKPE
jgi:alcohol dehydrogenase/L-iditol 2-dehydrogenase